jgi:hypothetical protein
LWNTATKETKILAACRQIIFAAITRPMPPRPDDGFEGYRYRAPEKFYRQQYLALVDLVAGIIETSFATDNWN